MDSVQNWAKATSDFYGQINYVSRFRYSFFGQNFFLQVEYLYRYSGLFLQNNGLYSRYLLVAEFWREFQI